MKFDSKFEQRLYRGVLKGLEYHPARRKYVVNETRYYQPDFIFDLNNAERFYIEAKGRFRTPSEAKKYLYIRDSLNTVQTLVFLFMKRDVKFPGARPRKDGTTRTQEEWCEDHGFDYFYEDTIGELIG